MPSDIFIKTASSTWSKMTSMFIKTASSTWSTAKSVWLYLDSGWTKVWPLSGVFNVTSPYITTSAGSTTPLYEVDGVRRIGTTVVGKNGTWNANGWTINSYQYRWRTYSTSTINDLNLDSQTALATYSSAVSLSIPATYDRKYLSFFIQANSSGGTAYNGYAESGTEYGGIQIVRSSPLNLTTSLSSYSPQEGSQLTYSSTWDETDRYAAESYRTTVYWYRNSSNSTSGGTYVGSGTTYTPTSSDIGNYIYVVETRYNSGSDYDYGLSTGVSATAITTSTVTSGLTPPTSVNIYSMSRYNDTSVNAVISFSGGSGPYYQLYWTTANPAPTTASYDSASTGSPIADVFNASSATTYYFYVRSSNQNLGDTNTNGSAASGTYSSYSTAYASYTFQSPSGGTASISGSTTPGSTLTLSTVSPTASPVADGISIIWRRADGGTGGNSFTGGSIMQTGGTTYVIDSPLVAYSSVGYAIRAEVTFNNGVGSQTANSNSIVITAPITKLATPTGVNASDNRSDGVNVTWTAVSGAAYYGVWWGGAPGYDSLADFGGNRDTTLITGTSYLDTAITTGTTRDYYVQAYRSGDPTGTKSDWGGPNSGTRVVATVAPTISSSSISPSSGTAGSTTFTASASVSGTPTPSVSYQWQYLSTSFSYVNVSGATSSSYSPPSNFNTIYPNYGFYCLITATNSAGSATARPSATLNSPASGTAPNAPSSGGGTYSTGTNYITNATFTRSTSGTTPITYYWTVASSSSQSGPWSSRNSGSISSSTLGGTQSIPQQSWNQSTYGSWARYQVYAQNSYGTSGTLEWLL